MRNRIIMATAEEINLRGFKFTMSDLTKRLSISKSSLYEHFSSKDELIDTILDIVLNDFEMQEEKIYHSDLPIFEKLQAALTITPKTFEPFHKSVYDDLRQNYGEKWKKVIKFRERRMERLTDLVKQGMENGIIRHVNPGVLQQIIESATDDFISYRFLAKNNITYTDAVADMLDILINGLKISK